MLTLKSGAYTPVELKALRRAVLAAYEAIECPPERDCENCPCKHACEDLWRLQEHIFQLTRKTRDSEES